jgi:hypothetical protein
MSAASRPKRYLGPALAWLSLGVAPGVASAAGDGTPAAEEARAAAPVSSSPASADSLVAQGILLRRAGDDAGALEVFEQALALAPGSTRVQVHLASVLQALGDWVAADAQLSAVLAKPGDDYVERNRRLLSDARDAIGAHLGELSVVGTPEGAAVRLDGRSLGALPRARSGKVAVGTHVLEVEADGHFPMARAIEIVPRQQLTESIELIARPHSEAAGAPLSDASQPTAGPDILTWGLAGAAGAAAIGGAVAWGLRESHVSTWNSDECLPFGSTRQRQCGDERDAARRYETLAITAGAGTALLAAGAVVSAWLSGDATPSGGHAALADCALSPSGLVCRGRF